MKTSLKTLKDMFLENMAWFCQFCQGTPMIILEILQGEKKHLKVSFAIKIIIKMFWNLQIR